MSSVLFATSKRLFYLIGIFGVVFTNLLRLFILILVGVEISPDLAVGLFHTNAGSIFFIAYFLIYYEITTRFCYKKISNKTRKSMPD